MIEARNPQLREGAADGFLGDPLDGSPQDSDPSRIQLMKPGDVAERLRVSRSWVYAAAADGRLPAIRLGGSDGPLRFIEADVEEWLERARAGWQPADRGSDTMRRARDLSPDEGA